MYSNAYERKTVLIKVIMALLQIKASEIAAKTHTSSSLVSRYISGERESVHIDLFLIEQCFNIKIKEYSYNAE